MKKLTKFVLSSLPLLVAIGCGDGSYQNQPNNSFADKRDAAKAARDAARAAGNVTPSQPQSAAPAPAGK
jgi:hypothetical protein